MQIFPPRRTRFRLHSFSSAVPRMTRLTLLDRTVARLEAAGIEDARRNAEWMLEDVLGVSRAAIYGHPGAHVVTGEALHLEALVSRRLTGEPLQYILGHTDFYGLTLRVTPDVLIPRPETEEVAEAAINALEGLEAPWVLDVGTGSGALALAIKHTRPDAEVFACDVSEAALAVAADNAERLGLDLAFVHADALSPTFARKAPPSFHVIVSNPPYVTEAERASLQPEVRDHEPGLALFVPDADPLVFYRALANLAGRLLHPNGWLVVETHADFGEAVRDLFAESGLADARIKRDMAGRWRIAAARYEAEGEAR